ncbi:MAG: hypothetical protein ABI147_13695 [Acidobacteriaceae bacterium]
MTERKAKAKAKARATATATATATKDKTACFLLTFRTCPASYPCSKQ